MKVETKTQPKIKANMKPTQYSKKDLVKSFVNVGFQEGVAENIIYKLNFADKAQNDSELLSNHQKQLFEVETKGELKLIRQEITTIETNLRKDIVSETKLIRQEMATIEANLKKDIVSETKLIRQEMTTIETNLNNKINSVEAKIDTVGANLKNDIIKINLTCFGLLTGVIMASVALVKFL